MATFASDYQTSPYQTSTRMAPDPMTALQYNSPAGGGGGSSWGPAEPTPYGPSLPSGYTPPVTTPSVPSVPGAGNQGYLAAAVKQKAAPKPVAPAAPTAPAYDFSADAQRGTDAMNLARTVAGMSAQAGAGFTTAPAGVNYSPTTYGTPNDGSDKRPLTNEERLANYKPEVVQGMYGGNEYATTNAGLEPPNPADYKSQAEYDAARGVFDKLSLMEQNSEANSAARQYADERNANQAATDEMRRRTAAADTAQKEVARKNANERIALATRLASRGLDPNTDTWAMQQVEQADRLDREEQQAAANIASIDMSTLRTQANDNARAALVKRIADITAARDKIAVTEAKKDKAESDLLLAQAKDENYQSQVDYRKSEAERKNTETGLKEDRNPALIALDEARANKTITDAEYTAGVKTLNTQADTELKKANTNRINTLLPDQAAKLKAEVAKLLRPPSTGGGGGGVATDISDDEFNKAYDSLLLAGVQPSKGNIALATKRLRGEENPTITETTLEGKTNNSAAVAKGKGTTDLAAQLKASFK